MTREEECWARALYEAEQRLSLNNNRVWCSFEKLGPGVQERYLALAKAAREAKYEDPIEALAREVITAINTSRVDYYSAIAERMYELGARPPKSIEPAK